MDEVRAELNRLRSERSRLRETLTSSGGGKSKAITGYAAVETSWRFATGDRDLDSSLYLYAEIGDDGIDPVTGAFAGRFDWDMNGLVESNGGVPAEDASFVGYNDLEGDRLTQRVDMAYVDFNRVGPIDKIRLGRQFHEGFTGGHFDGAQIFARPFEATSVTAYAGVPVNFYKQTGDSPYSSDRIYGGSVTNRWIDNLALTLDVQGVRDRTSLYGTQQDYNAVLGARYRFLDNLRASLVESVINGQQRDLNGNVSYWNADHDFSLTFNYIWMPEKIEELTSEYTPYTDILNALEPYQLFRFMGTKGLGDHLEVGGELTLRELVEKTDESAYNKEYTFTQASISLLDLPVEDLRATLHWEHWDTVDDSQYTLGGEVRKRLGRAHSLEAGTYFSKFKYREFTYIETLDVQTYFAKWRWAFASDMSFQLKAEVEDADDDDTYNTLSMAFTVQF